MSATWILPLLAALALLLALLARRLQQSRARAARVEARLAAVLAAAGTGISVWSAAARLTACNARFRELYPGVPLKPGLELEDLLRFTVTRGLVQVPDDETEAWVQARLAGVMEGARTTVRTAAGRWLELRSAPVDGGDNLLLYTDVTDAEETRGELSDRNRQLDRLNADLELLRGVLAAAAAGEPFDAAVARVVALVCGWARWPVGRAWRVADGDPPRCLPLPASLVVRGEKYEPLRPLLADEPAADGDSLAARAARAGRVMWVANVEGDPAFQGGGRPALPGIRGACAVPVRSGPEVVAVLEFLAPDQLVPAEAATRLLESVALILAASSSAARSPSTTRSAWRRVGST